jgi:tetratricopeptide (TPR) repeat protein
VGTNNTFCSNGYDIYAGGGAYAYAISNVYSRALPSSIYGNVFVTGINSVCGPTQEFVGNSLTATEEISPELKDADERYLALLRKMHDDKTTDKYDANKYIGEHQELIETYKKCVKSGADNGTIKAALSKLSHLHKILGQFQAFNQYLNEIMFLGTFKNAESYFKRYSIWNYVENKQYENALRTADGILAASGNDERLSAEMLYEKGLVYKYYLNDNSKALEMFESISSLYPSSPLTSFAKTETGSISSSSLKGIATEKNSASKSVDFELFNYPNPFNPTTVIRFSLPTEGHVSLKVYDMLGRDISTLVNQNRTAGNHQVSFDASNLPSGMYLYKLEAAGKSIVRKMMLVR